MQAFLRFAQRMHRTRLTALSAVVILTIVLSAVFADAILPYDPITDMVFADANKGPSAAHPFGTDYLGRDLLSRVVYGARVSLLVGCVAVAVSALVGVPLGVIAGFVGGVTDTLLMRLCDAIWSFPSLILAVGITAGLGPGLANTIIAIALVRIPLFARLARGSTLAMREMAFVTAARSLGAGSMRIMRRHILPNISAPIIVQATLELGSAMIAEASLSFLGMGVQPPSPSWGTMLRDGHLSLRANPWLALFPGLALLLTVLALNFLGDALRSALDPKLWQRDSG
jgi:peptide/nickel transport system permease protein